MTVDLAISPDLKKVWLIEVGAPNLEMMLMSLGNAPPVAGTALFDFSKEEDKNVITGKSPFELRILSEFPEENWRELFRAVAVIIAEYRGLDKSVFDAFSQAEAENEATEEEEKKWMTYVKLGAGAAVLAAVAYQCYHRYHDFNTVK